LTRHQQKKVLKNYGKFKVTVNDISKEIDLTEEKERAIVDFSF
jgi:hypothetical protein